MNLKLRRDDDGDRRDLQDGPIRFDARQSGRPCSTLLPQPVAVIDVETTGKENRRTDRVVELGAVILNEDGVIVREFVTLVNPERDVGPTWKHGITARDVLYAPIFAEIAREFMAWLDGVDVWAAHNADFDRGMLDAEFERLDVALPVRFFCTMRPFGFTTLSDCCQGNGVEPPRTKHSALEDARATARLLTTIVESMPEAAWDLVSPQSGRWPIPETFRCRPLVTREESRAKQREVPSLMQSIATQLADCGSGPHSDAADVAYTAMLSRALVDLVVDEAESKQLADAAARLKLGLKGVARLHSSYIQQVLAYALSDGTVSDHERTHLHKLALLLGFEASSIDSLISDATLAVGSHRGKSQLRSEPDPAMVGKTICITGDLNATIGGKRIEKERAHGLALKQGLFFKENVTKKNLDYLVVADEYTQSKKRKLAEQYGIPIIAEFEFWRLIGIAVD